MIDQTFTSTMSAKRSMDEEKALLQAYYDDEVGDTDPSPPLPSEVPVDGSVNQKGCKKKKILKHLVFFSLIFLVWQTIRAYRTGQLTCGHWRDHGVSESPDMWHFTGLGDNTDRPSEGFPWPPQVKIEECAEWPSRSPHEHDDHRGRHHPGHHHHTFDTSFSLPASADILAFFARGPLSVGHFNVEQGTEDTDEIVVNVATNWRGPQELLDNVQLCKFTGKTEKKGAIGVGIVSVKGEPRHRHRHGHHRVWFEVNVRLPASSDKQLELKSFFTYLPVFTQTIGDLGGVYFDGIGLKGSVSSIKVQSLSAKRTYINAGVGAIKGNFSTSSSLELVTSSGEIDVDVDLINDSEGDDWTHLLLSTATGAINANLSLHTESDSNVGGKFNVTSGLSAGALTLNNIVAPEDSTVDLTAHASIGSIEVSLYKTFEGKFDLRSSAFSQPTVVKRKYEDERKRQFEFSQVGRGVTQGSVWWDAGDGESDGKERGDVNIMNSLGNVVLKV